MQQVLKRYFSGMGWKLITKSHVCGLLIRTERERLVPKAATCSTFASSGHLRTSLQIWNGAINWPFASQNFSLRHETYNQLLFSPQRTPFVRGEELWNVVQLKHIQLHPFGVLCQQKQTNRPDRVHVQSHVLMDSQLMTSSTWVVSWLLDGLFAKKKKKRRIIDFYIIDSKLKPGEGVSFFLSLLVGSNVRRRESTCHLFSCPSSAHIQH